MLARLSLALVFGAICAKWIRPVGDWARSAGVTSIGDHAFYDCASLTNLTIPTSGLILSGHTLYATTQRGGAKGFGTAFSLSLPVP